MPAARFGQRMGDARLVDMMLGALNDPFQGIHMGVTAENVAQKYGISREAQDALALESHRRAAQAIASGYFKEQILPITIASKKGDIVFEQDEHVRMNATAEDFSKLKPVFAKENGTVTAGNASGINDAAAAVVLMERSVAEQRGVEAAGAAGGVRARGRRSGVHGHRPGAGHAQGARTGRPDGRRSRRHRSERSICRAGVCGQQGTWARSREGQSERLRHFARPPDRRDRRIDHREGAVRTAAHRRALRARDDVHWRRAGHRGDLRADLTPGARRLGSMQQEGTDAGIESRCRSAARWRGWDGPVLQAQRLLLLAGAGAVLPAQALGAKATRSRNWPRRRRSSCRSSRARSSRSFRAMPACSARGRSCCGLDAKTDDPSGVHGEYQYTDTGEVILIAGDRDGDTLEVEESNDGTHITGNWVGKFAADGSVAGDRMNVDDSDPQPFDLRPLAAGQPVPAPGAAAQRAGGRGRRLRHLAAPAAGGAHTVNGSEQPLDWRVSCANKLRALGAFPCRSLFCFGPTRNHYDSIQTQARPADPHRAR